MLYGGLLTADMSPIVSRKRIDDCTILGACDKFWPLAD